MLLIPPDEIIPNMIKPAIAINVTFIGIPSSFTKIPPHNKAKATNKEPKRDCRKKHVQTMISYSGGPDFFKIPSSSLFSHFLRS